MYDRNDEMNRIHEIFKKKSTEEIAQFLLGMYLEHETASGILGGYIVDVEAYLGPEDMAAHSFGLRKTPRLKAMYEKPGTIYLYTMHTHLILNMITREVGMPQGVMIRAIQPISGLEQMEMNRKGQRGKELTNGPGKLVAALGITKNLYGQSIFESKLKIVPEKRNYPKKIVALPRIGIPNKGAWTTMPLRYIVSGNPYISKQKKCDIDTQNFGWQGGNETDEKRNNIDIFGTTTNHPIGRL